MQRIIIDLHLEPRIYTIDNFLSGVECSSLIALGKQHGMSRATVSGEKAAIISDARTNDVCWLENDLNVLTRRITDRIAGLVGVPLTHTESLQLIHYGKGAQYRAHFDAFDKGTEPGDRNLELGGQRIITALGYLNTVPKGGGTEFPNLKITVPAESGKLLVFHNCTAGTHVCHKDSLHAGLPVLEGEKWAFNLWFRAHERK